HRDLTLAELTPRSERRFRSRTSLTPRLINIEASSKRGRQLPKTPVPSNFFQSRQQDLHVIDEVEYLEPLDMSPCSKQTNVNQTYGKSPKTIQFPAPVSSSALPVAQPVLQEKPDSESLSRNSSATYVAPTENIEQVEGDEDDDEQLHRSIPGAFDFVPAQNATYEPLLSNSILGELFKGSKPKHVQTPPKAKTSHKQRPKTPIIAPNLVQILVTPNTPELHLQSTTETTSGVPPVAAPANQTDLNTANATPSVDSLPKNPNICSVKSPAPRPQKKSLPSSKPSATMPPPNLSKGITKPQRSSVKPSSPVKEMSKIKTAVPTASKPFNHRIPVPKEAAKLIPATSAAAPVRKSKSISKTKGPQAESNAPARQSGIFSFVPQSLRDVLSRSPNGDSMAPSQVSATKSIEPSIRTEVYVAETLTTPVDPPIIPTQVSPVTVSTGRPGPKLVTVPVISNSPKQMSKPSAKKRALELTPTKPKGNDQRLKRQKLVDEVTKEMDILPVVLQSRNMVPLRRASPEAEIPKPRSRMHPEATIPKPPIFTSKVNRTSSATFNSRLSKNQTVDEVEPTASGCNLVDHSNPRVHNTGARADTDIFGSVIQDPLSVLQNEPPKRRTTDAVELPGVVQPLE
ncbi:13975_t:CDS:2, partial [Acaulospora colombiana]